MENTARAPRPSNWCDLITPYPIAFSQVREDPANDLAVIENLNRDHLKGIMIASGGCTAAVLLASQKFDALTLVDMNPAQIALAKLKVHLLTHAEPEQRLRILGHLPHETNDRKTYLAEFCQEQDLSPDVWGPLDKVSQYGPDCAGRYEFLFRQLSHALMPIHKDINLLLASDDVDQQINILEKLPHIQKHIKECIEDIMSLPNLVALFGSAATQNAVRPFPEHFFLQTMKALKTLPGNTTSYLSQFLTSRFQNDPHPWINIEPQSNLITPSYVLASMGDALKASDQKYDFIHLSNILDWLTADQAQDLLTLTKEHLTPGGVTIIRQLNSHLDFTSVFPELSWDMDFADKLHQKDRSFFYQRLYVGYNK